MKTPFDPRHQKRRQLVQSLFTWGFQKSEDQDETSNKIVQHLSEIDSLISKNAPQWPIDQINKIDLAILRLAIFELSITKTEPEKVIVDEAVELAKEFGSQASPSFINGVLGNMLKSESQS